MPSTMAAFYEGVMSMGVQLWIFVPVFFLILFWKPLVAKAKDLVSRILHIFLCYRYPIKHLEDHTTLPTCRYQWPNGQGDSAKFLEGGKNSNLWGKQFGSLYRIWSGMTPEVVLTRPEHIQAVFRDSDKHHKAVDNNSGYLMSQILGQCVGLVSGEQWRNVRTVVEKAFTRDVSTRYITLIEERTQNFFADLQKSKNLAQSLLDPAEDLKLLPFLVVAEVIYGKLSQEMEQQLRTIAPRREGLFKHVIRGGLARFSFSQYLPTAANQALSQFKSDWHTFNQMACERAISENINAPIVAMFSAANAGTISYEQLYQTLDEMLYANLDVTIGGISWNVVFLAANAEVQAQIRAEVAEARQRADNQGRKLDQYLLSSSSLLAACVLESARLRPLAAFSVPQSAPTPRVVAGYVMPAGTNFLVDSYALNIRNPFWGEDRDAYRPGRFLERKGTQTRYNYWRFGFGPRQCMGKYVADLIIRALLVHLVEEYDLGMVKGNDEGNWGRNGETWINHPQMLVRCKRKSNEDKKD